MNRSGLLLFALGAAGVLLITVVRHPHNVPSTASLNDLVIGILASAMGAFILARRRALAQQSVSSYERAPNALRGFFSWPYRLLRFKTYEAFQMFNTVLVGTGMLAVGLIALGFVAYHLVRGS